MICHYCGDEVDEVTLKHMRKPCSTTDIYEVLAKLKQAEKEFGIKDMRNMIHEDVLEIYDELELEYKLFGKTPIETTGREIKEIEP